MPEIANALLRRDREPAEEDWTKSYWKIRNSLVFLSSFHQLRAICEGEPGVLARHNWRDPIIKSLCDEVSEGALRVPSRNEFGSGGHFSESFDDIEQAFNCYQNQWKAVVVKVRNLRINSLFRRSLRKLYCNYYTNNEKFMLIDEGSDSDLVPWLLHFIRHEDLVAPRSVQWRAFYRKISVFVADWQLPPALPGSHSYWDDDRQPAEILASQLHWAAENGRLFEAMKFLGSLAIEDWQVRAR